jgi:hypothetical protein
MMYLMACGHTSNAHDENGDPVCIMCLGTHNGARVPVKECNGNEGLKGRRAKCAYGDSITDSRWSLPFFQYRPDKEYDEYYCGCMGWN